MINILIKMQKSLLFIICFQFIVCFQITETSDSLNYLNQQVEILRESNQFDKLIKIYSQILDYQLDSSPEDLLIIGETYNSLGELYLNKEDYQSAEKYFNLSLDIYEKYFLKIRTKLNLSLKNLSKLYSLTGNFGKLQSVTEKISLLQSTNDLIISDSLSNVWDSTLWIPIAHIDTMLIDSTFWFPPLTPDERSLELMELGFSFIKSGLYSEAINSFSDALSSKTQVLDSDYFLNFKILDNVINQEFSEALTINIALDSLNVESWFFLSMCFYQSNQLDSAIVHMKKYINYIPDDYRGYLMIANYSLQKSDWFTALEYYQKAIWMQNANLDARNGLALSLFYLENYSEALKAYKIILNLDPYHYDS